MPIKKIEIKNLIHVFNSGEEDEITALNGLNTSISINKITAIIGPSSSGKSVLLQHLNGLLRPTEGEVIIDDFVFNNSNKKNKKLQSLRKKIGFLFQFPEQQLFEETIEKDIMFGPLNFGFTKKKAFMNTKKYMKLLKLPDIYLSKSPLQLSGGEKRKAAIAGIFAYEPDLILVDQLGRGLDAETKKNFLKLLLDLKNNFNKTVVVGANDMDAVLTIADEIILLDKGQIILKTTPLEIFKNEELCKKYEIQIPKTFKFIKFLKKRKFPIKNLNNRTEDDLIHSILEEIKKN